MNAQKSWKQAYRRMHGSKDYFDRSNAFGAMQRFRREAALERKIESQQREIIALIESVEVYHTQTEAQQRRIAELNAQLDDALVEINSRDEREALRDKLEWG